MVALLVGTHLWYPRDALVGRYDFLFLMAVAIQIAMLGSSSRRSMRRR